MNVIVNSKLRKHTKVLRNLFRLLIIFFRLHRLIKWYWNELYCFQTKNVEKTLMITAKRLVNIYDIISCFSSYVWIYNLKGDWLPCKTHRTIKVLSHQLKTMYNCLLFSCFKREHIKQWVRMTFKLNHFVSF